MFPSACRFRRMLRDAVVTAILRDAIVPRLPTAQNVNKNSSGDEIANVDFLRRYRTRTSKYKKRELTSFNKLDDS